MYRISCLLILLMGIHCAGQGSAVPDLGMASADLSTAPADLAGAAADLAMAPADLGAPAPTRVCSTDNWCWESPLPQGNTLNGVWGTGAKDMWAVGNQGTILPTTVKPRWGERWSVSCSCLRRWSVKPRQSGRAKP